MEAEKSHGLLSARCKPRKTDGIIQSESGGLRTRGIDISPGLIPAIQQSGTSMSKVGEDPCSSLADKFTFLWLFCSIQAPSGLADAQLALVREILFAQFTDSHANLF